MWFDYWTDKRYQGYQTIQFATQLDRLPMMVHGGFFILMVELMQSTDDYSTQTLQFIITLTRRLSPHQALCMMMGLPPTL